jgi:hypothetical protein
VVFEMDVVQAFHLWRKQNGFLTALEVAQAGHDATILDPDEAYHSHDMVVEFSASVEGEGWHGYQETLMYELSPAVHYWATDIVQDFEDPIGGPLQAIPIEVSTKGRIYHKDGKKKAKRTIYRGREYDSKTEATWAHIFDQVGIEHRPQPETQIPGLYWRPDFLIPGANSFLHVPHEAAFVEVKYGWPTTDERNFIDTLLVSYAGSTVVLWLLHPWNFEKKQPRIPVGRIYHLQDGVLKHRSMTLVRSGDGVIELAGAPCRFPAATDVIHAAMTTNEFSYPNEVPQQPTQFTKSRPKRSRRKQRT